MSLHSHRHSFFTLAAILLLWAPQLSAQTTPLKYVPDPTFSVLSRKGTPKDITYGGGKRSVCLTRANPVRGLTAILPPADFGGLSATANPTFWVYLPYATERPLTGVLSVRLTDSFRSAPFVKVPISLPSQPGLVRLRLPASLVGVTSPFERQPTMLAWTLTVVCDEENLSRNPFVGGLVMVKPNPELLQRIADLAQSERIVELARSGYWYDALDLVASSDGGIGVQRLMESAGWKPSR
ncbi:DUF928 domain-containing protein [Chamaesiphon sp.]|uniref:DUF928 domain-containing protein n=1 Tax=Chamaesiphon sp. TaxID=2814140 RepID=UPI003594874A